MTTDSRDLEVKRLVRQHWDGRAPTFDEGADHSAHSQAQHDAWIAALRQITGGRRQRILDIGCGTGFLALLLAELGNAVDGIDLAPRMLELARQKAAERRLWAHFSEGDAERLRADDAYYDMVIERHVIWTLPNPGAALREWSRVVKPGGPIVLIEGNWGMPSNLSPEYQRIQHDLPLHGGKPAEELRRLVAGVGLAETVVLPLMDDTLWGRPSPYDRYALVANRP
ncbi:MAG: class I SAM-dependent methyltransferase [SAR202 cluster bacterium]|nr:class I SAM-dependent methyltransferase [SAR202 cluster bacterium]